MRRRRIILLPHRGVISISFPRLSRAMRCSKQLNGIRKSQAGWQVSKRFRPLAPAWTESTQTIRTVTFEGIRSSCRSDILYYPSRKPTFLGGITSRDQGKHRRVQCGTPSTRHRSPMTPLRGVINLFKRVHAQ
jgi:hypothetical protein